VEGGVVVQRALAVGSLDAADRLVDRAGTRRRRDVRIEPFERRPQPAAQHHLVEVVALGLLLPRRDGVAVDAGDTEFSQPGEGGGFDGGFVKLHGSASRLFRGAAMLNSCISEILSSRDKETESKLRDNC